LIFGEGVSMVFLRDFKAVFEFSHSLSLAGADLLLVTAKMKQLVLC
jgi:hypothetical protein